MKIFTLHFRNTSTKILSEYDGMSKLTFNVTNLKRAINKELLLACILLNSPQLW